MTKRVGMVLGLVVALGAAGAALAGTKLSIPVSVLPGTAYGAVGSARNSTDPTQYIACNVQANGGVLGGVCAARNAAGVQATCFTSDPATVQVMASLDETSLVQFNYDATGRCTFVLVEGGSYFEPKK